MISGCFQPKNSAATEYYFLQLVHKSDVQWEMQLDYVCWLHTVTL